jgi:hypothetical protein
LAAGWRDTPAFKAYGGSFFFKASPAQVAAFQAARPSLTAAQLAVRIPATAFVEATNADLLPGGVPTIIGWSVALSAKESVGKVDSATTIDGAALRSGNLNATELDELLVARLPGDAARDINADGSLKSLILTVRRPVSVNAYDGLRVEADDGDVAVVQPHHSLSIDSVVATKGQVHLVAAGGIGNQTVHSPGITARVPLDTEKTPTVRLFSLFGSVGDKGNEIKVVGHHEVVAPRGEVHTNPPPVIVPTLGHISGHRPNGTPIVRRLQLIRPPLLPGHRLLFSNRAPNAGKVRWTAAIPKTREGLNHIWVVHVNASGHRSRPVQVSFVLDTRPPAAPRIRLAAVAAGLPRQLVVMGVEPQAKVIYSVNGGPWAESYELASGRNLVRVRQVDQAGNVSRAAVLRFRIAVPVESTAKRVETGFLLSGVR